MEVDYDFKYVKVETLGDNLLELTPKGLRGVDYCIMTLLELQKQVKVLSAFVSQERLYVITGEGK